MKKIITHYSPLITNNKGLTLIEVLVAIVILSIGLLGVAMMQYVAIGGNAFGREMQIATELGQERLEIIKSQNYADIVTGMTTSGSNWYQTEALTDPDPARYGGLRFTRVWWVANNCKNIDVTLNPADPCNIGAAITCPPSDLQNDFRALEVRVCWVDKNGGNHSVTLNGVKWNETAAP